MIFQDDQVMAVISEMKTPSLLKVLNGCVIYENYVKL